MNNMGFAPLDTNRVTCVFLLSDIGEKIDVHTRSIGWTFDHQMEQNPRKWFNVVIVVDNQPFKRKQVVAVCSELYLEPGDMVLVWDREHGSRFVEWQQNDTYDSYESVHGVQVDKI